MRLPFFLVFVFALVAATRVPPITQPENWANFHIKQGCWMDLYQYGTDVLSDETYAITTRVTFLADFSKPYYAPDDTSNMAAKYAVEYAVLSDVITEMDSQAFPVSNADFGNTAFNSLGVRYMNYYPVPDEEDAFNNFTASSVTDSGSNEFNLNDPNNDCLSSFLSYMTSDYNEITSDSANVLHTFSYKDSDYLAGIKYMISKLTADETNTRCHPDERCFLVVSRVNPYSFSQAFQDAIKIYKQWGYQVITVDSADNYNYPEQTGLASNPVSRFGHILPNTTYQPEVNLASAKIIQAIRGGYSACMTFGEHHVLTFDGVGYDHQQLGDFVLVKDLYMDSFEVQIRNELCYNQTNAFNQPDVVCTTGFALKADGRTLAIYYDRFADQLAVTINGTLWKPGYLSFDEFQAYVIRKYPAGYDVGIYVANPFTYVHVTFHYTASVEVYPSPSLIYGLAGLCGTYDNCNHDEFYTMNNVFTDDQDQFTNSWHVVGGESLFEGPKYISTNPSPFVMHPPFTDPNWEAYDFALDEYDDDTLAYLAELCHEYRDATSFLYHACVEAYILDWIAADADSTGAYYYDQLDHYVRDYDYYDLLIREPLAHVCSDMCENGYSRMGGFSHVDINCTGLCDSEMENWEGIGYALPTEKTQGDVVRAPIAESHWGQKAFFYPPMGGEYLIRVRSFDCCKYSDNLEFTLKINCTRPQLVVFVAPDNEAADSEIVQVNIDEFAFPLVNLQAQLFDWTAEEDEVLHVVWTLISNPGKQHIEILNKYTLYPSFIPQTIGVYTFQVVVTDGCSVSSDTVQVNVSCYTRDYNMNTLYSDTMIYEMSQEWIQSYFSTTYLTLQESCMTPIKATTSWKFTEFPWTYAPVDWTYSLVREYDSDILKIEQVLLPTYNKATDVIESLFKVYWTVTAQSRTWSFDVITDYCLNTAGKHPFPCSELKYPVDVPQSSALAEHEYATLRAEARHHLTEVIVEHYLERKGSYYTTYWIKSAECWIWTNVAFKKNSDGSFYSQLSMWAQNAYRETAQLFFAKGYLVKDEQTSFGWDEIDGKYYEYLRWKSGGQYIYSQYMGLLHDNEYFHTGHCPGTYRITLSVKDKFACTARTDNYLMDISVIRRPMPLPIQPCVDIYFDYYYYMSWYGQNSAGNYPDAYLLGYDSVTPAWRDMDFLWAILDIWDGSSATLTREDELYLATEYINPRTWQTWFYAPIGADDFLDLQFSRGSDKFVLNDFGNRVTNVHEVTYVNGTYNTTGYHYYDHAYLRDSLKNPAVKFSSNFDSVPDVYQARLYLTDHAMNSMDEVTVVFRCRAHPVPVVGWAVVGDIDVSLPTETTDGIELDFYSLDAVSVYNYFPARFWGALPTWLDFHCEFSDSAALAWCRRWGALTGWYGGAIAGCCDQALYFDVDAAAITTTIDWTSGNTEQGLFYFYPRIVGSYGVEVMLGDQCSFGTSWITVPVVCDTSHPSISYTIYSDTSTSYGDIGNAIVVEWDPDTTTWDQARYVAIDFAASVSSDATNYFCPMTFFNSSTTLVDFTTTNCVLADDNVEFFLYNLVDGDNSLINGYSFPIWSTQYDGCNFNQRMFTVTYTCVDHLPSAASWSVYGVYYGTSTTGYLFSTDNVFGYNMSAYSMWVHSTNFATYSTYTYYYYWYYWYEYQDDKTKDLDFDYEECVLTWGAVNTYTSNDAYTYFVITNCDYDQTNKLYVQFAYTDGCFIKLSGSVSFDISCMYTFSFTPVIPRTVTWSDGQFPVVCGSVPDSNFHWGKPWDYDRAVTARTSWATYDEFHNFDAYDCNFQSCVWYHQWDFTTATPDNSVFQTETSTNTTMTTYSSRVKASMLSKTCGSAADFFWMLNHRYDTDCGMGYYISYDYTITEHLKLYYSEYTWLVSGWDNAWNYIMVASGATPADDYNYNVNNNWYTSGYDTTTGYRNYIVNPLTQKRDDRENMLLAACFRPDVDGDYTLRLSVWDGCWNRKTDQTVTVTADCGDHPHITVTQPTNVVKGTRYSFVATVTDDNDDMLTYQWTLSYCDSTKTVEDLTDYVTNAHALSASFIPIYMGQHCYTLTVSDGCNDPYAATGKFNVTCNTQYSLPDPAAPQTSEGDDIIYSVYDFNGVGLIPIKDFVTNNVEGGQGVSFHWRMIGFDPAYTTYAAYAANTRIEEEVVVGAAGSVSVSICLITLLFSLIMFF